MAINTPLGDTLDGYLAGLLSGRSAVCRWKGVDTSRIYSKVGADLSEYDIDSKMASFDGRIPTDMYKRMRKLVPRIPWTTRLTVLMTIDAILNSGLLGSRVNFERVAAIVAGHNINGNYQFKNRTQFEEGPGYGPRGLHLRSGWNPWPDLHHGSRVRERERIIESGDR
jgi:3-oxoacyl-(acyl-carrier-protein) synthase